VSITSLGLDRLSAPGTRTISTARTVNSAQMTSANSSLIPGSFSQRYRYFRATRRLRQRDPRHFAVGTIVARITGHEGSSSNGFDVV
jgi:hypothetical protein